MPIHILEEKPLDVALGLGDRRRKADEGLAGPPRVIGARRRDARDPALRFADRVLDEGGDDAAHKFVDDARAFEARMLVADMRENACNEGRSRYVV